MGTKQSRRSAVGTLTLFLPPLLLKEGKKLGLCPKKHFSTCLTLKHVRRLFRTFPKVFLLPGCLFNRINVRLFDPILKEDDPYFLLPENRKICSITAAIAGFQETQHGGFSIW